MTTGMTELSSLLKSRQDEILVEWQSSLLSSGSTNDNRLPERELRDQTRSFLSLLSVTNLENTDVEGREWAPVKDFLEELSRSRAIQGFTSDQTASFIFSLKRPFFNQLQKQLQRNSATLVAELWKTTELLDQLGLYTIKAFQKSREDVIRRQQQELLELSTPVVKLWDGVLALPIIGTLDSARTQIVMESLLQRIVDTGSEIAIIDITGVPTVDTLVTQYLLKTATAIRLLGADCIISGIRPQIAQTIVHLGVDLGGVTTKASLADALSLALKRSGYQVSKKAS